MQLLVVSVCVVNQKTAYMRRISDWSSDVCSSDLAPRPSQRDKRRVDLQSRGHGRADHAGQHRVHPDARRREVEGGRLGEADDPEFGGDIAVTFAIAPDAVDRGDVDHRSPAGRRHARNAGAHAVEDAAQIDGDLPKSEEHTSELQSLMRISYAVFCLKKTKKQ